MLTIGSLILTESKTDSRKEGQNAQSGKCCVTSPFHDNANGGREECGCVGTESCIVQLVLLPRLLLGGTKHSVQRKSVCKPT